MKYKIQMTSTYLVTSSDRETAEAIVRRGWLNPEKVEVETLEEVAD